ncbi:MAG: hypothetical protein ACPHEP_04395 [Acidimicrobiales bacterium]
MPGFSGRVSFEGDVEGCKNLLSVAIELAESLKVWKETQGLPSVIKAYDLGGGAHCVIGHLQTLSAMRITVPTQFTPEYVDVEVEYEIDQDVGVMDVISGRVDQTLIEEEEASLPDPEDPDSTIVDTFQLLKGYTPCTYTATRYTDHERRYRLAVVEDQMWAPQEPSDNIYSQYAHVRQSQYSGAMRRLVQLMFGVGQPVIPNWEQRWIEEGGYVPLSHDQVVDGLQTYVESGFGLYESPQAAPSMRYDYRFSKTHGVAFDADENPWLIEISAGGVLATRLQLDPVSLTDEGRERYLAVSPELEEVFDEFGGFPLFNQWPVGEELTKQKNGGDVVELLSSSEVSDFYGKSAFSSEIGWSFNEEGTEAHNCCSGASNGLQTGHHFKIAITLERDTLPPLDGDRAELASYVTSAADVRKCRRLSNIQASSLVRQFQIDAESGQQAFDNEIAEPSLTFECEMEEVSSGTLYHPGNPLIHPQIKFPEPFLPGLKSFDFSPTELGASTDRCDAPMFVTHVKGELDIVRYALDLRPRDTPPAENTRDICQFTGQWTYTTYGGTPYLAGNFYSNRWDFRKEITPEDTVTVYEGRKLGVQGKAAVPTFFASCFYVNSRTHFGITSEGKSREGHSFDVAVAIPFHTREAYYMTTAENWTGVSEFVGFHTESTPGPELEFWRISNTALHFVSSSCAVPTNINAGSSGCVAKKFGYWYNEDVCVDDEIPAEIQYSVCPAVVFAFSDVTVYAPLWGGATIGSASFGDFIGVTPWSESTIPEPAAEWQVNLMTDSCGVLTPLKGSSRNGVVSGDDPPSYWWWDVSPDPQSGAFTWLAMAHSCLGQQVTNYMVDMDGATEHHTGPEDMHGSVYTAYTGVIR